MRYVIFMLIAACGTQQTTTTTAAHSATCRDVSCDAPDRAGRTSGVGFHVVWCVWSCATYEDEERSYVAVVYEREGNGCWTQKELEVHPGICPAD